MGERAVLHQAGEPNRIRALQYCDLCGTVLVDNSRIMVPEGSEGPRYFEPGSLVTRGPGFVTAAKDPDAVPCTAHEPGPDGDSRPLGEGGGG